MHVYPAELIRVVDGDTLEMRVDLGFEVSVTTRIRILDLDTPEIFHPSCKAEKLHGTEAKIKAIQLLEGKELVIITVKRKKGKYGRYLAHICIEPDGLDFAEEMKKAGFQKKDKYA